MSKYLKINQSVLLMTTSLLLVSACKEKIVSNNDNLRDGNYKYNGYSVKIITVYKNEIVNERTPTDGEYKLYLNGVESSVFKNMEIEVNNDSFTAETKKIECDINPDSISDFKVDTVSDTIVNYSGKIGRQNTINLVPALPCGSTNINLCFKFENKGLYIRNCGEIIFKEKQYIDGKYKIFIPNQISFGWEMRNHIGMKCEDVPIESENMYRFDLKHEYSNALFF